MGMMIFSVMFIICSATTYTTITIDGTNSDWDADEIFTDCSNADNAYFTWNADYIYFAISDAEADYGNMATFMYFDIDPDGSDGTTDAYSWTNNITTPFNADYVVVWKNGGSGDYIEARGWNGSSWNQIVSEGSANYNSGDIQFSVAPETDGDYREVKIKRSILGVGSETDEISFCSFTEQQWGSNYRYFVFPKNDGSPGDLGNSSADQSVQHYRGYILGTGYSPNVSGSYDQTLPVELSTFTAMLGENGPQLNWTTQSEENNAGWNVYRGETETAWQQQNVLQLNSAMGLIEGAGTTSEPTDYQFEDIMPTQSDNSYWYWLESVDYSGVTELYGPAMVQIPAQDPGFIETPDMPHAYGLQQNYPNPFNPSTEISFTLRQGGPVELSVYNLKGQLLRTLIAGETMSGNQQHSVVWDGKDQFGNEVTSGIYLYKLRTLEKVYSKKMLLVK
jgi:hypothetical protein